MGLVYLLANDNNDGLYKIGVTKKKLEKRIEKLQTGNPGEIYAINYYESEHPFFIETTLHNKFKSKKVMNEWFELSDLDVKNFIKTCEDIDEIVKSMDDNPFFPKNLK